MKSAKRHFAFVIMGLTSIFVAQTVAAGGDECCTDPGHVSDCWWKDGERDSVVTSGDGKLLDGTGLDCPSNRADIDPARDGADGRGLCMCDEGDDDQCGAGICTDVDATSDPSMKVCGPSYCNGFQICSCWGGCEEGEYGVDDSGDPFLNPEVACIAHGIECNQGNYPPEPSGKYLGYCIGNPDAGPPGEPFCPAEFAACFWPLGNNCVRGECRQDLSTPDPLDLMCVRAALSTTALSIRTECCDPVAIGDPNDDIFVDDGDVCTSDYCCVEEAGCVDVSGATVAYFHDFSEAIEEATVANGSDTNSNGTIDPWEAVDCAGQVPMADICAKSRCVGPVGGPTVCTEWRLHGDDCGVWAHAVCGEGFECVGDVCTMVTPGGSAIGPTEECATTNITVGLVGDADFVDLTNACAVDDHDAVAPAGSRFESCQENSYLASDENSDLVVRFTYEVNNTEPFYMEHVLWMMERGEFAENWEPYFHTYLDDDDGTDGCGVAASQMSCATDNCTDGFNNTNYPYSNPVLNCTSFNAGQKEFDKAMTVGPLPIRDVPNADGSIASSYDYSGAIVFDSLRDTDLGDGVDQRGGIFDVKWRTQTHINDTCQNSGSYLGTPIFDDFTDWKQRYRGTLDGYSNYNDPGACTVSSPTAFFRTEFSSGASGTAGTDAYWPYSYKVYTDPDTYHPSANIVDTVLTGKDSTAGMDISSTMQGSVDCGEGTKAVDPQELWFNSDEANGSAWIAVSKHVAGDADDLYELNALRVPRPFHGFQEPFGWSGSGCTKPVSTEWELDGHRIDFIPSNDSHDGFSVVSTVPGAGAKTAGGWLTGTDSISDAHPKAADPGNNKICVGTKCTDGTSPLVREFPFAFPYSGELYTHYCLNPAGQIIFGNSIGMQCSYNTMANSEETTKPWVAPFWGSIIPCWCSKRESDMWGDLDGWDGDSCRQMSAPAQVPATVPDDGRSVLSHERINFEGTRAVVVTWNGFDGNRDQVDGDARQSGTGGTDSYTGSPQAASDNCNSWSWRGVECDQWGGNCTTYNAYYCSSCTDSCNPQAYNTSNCISGNVDCQTGGPMSGSDKHCFCNCNDSCTLPGATYNFPSCYRGGTSHALQHQVILREDGRFTFFYKTAEAYIETILQNENAAVAGISGTRYSEYCSGDNQCNNGGASGGEWDWPTSTWGIGALEYYCDNDDHGVTDFRPGYRCSKDIGQSIGGASNSNDWHLEDGHDNGVWQR